MKPTISFNSRAGLCLAAGLLLGAAAALGQSISANANGANSSFSSADRTHQAAQLPASPVGVSSIPSGFQNLRLDSGILLQSTVYGEPDLTTEARVDDRGMITLPLIGAVQVGGKTVGQARELITNKYRAEQILKNPQITLHVLQYVENNVTVVGAVQSPGRFPLLGPTNLLDVLGLAGGETTLAGREIDVSDPMHSNSPAQTYEYVRGEGGDQLKDATVKPGELVRVKRAGIVYVLGAVYRPGGYVMQEDGKLNVLQAISLAQGTLMQAKMGDIRVVRRQSDGSLKEIPIPYNKMMKGKDEPLQLEAQDIVYVPVSKIKSVFTAGSSIVGQAGAASIYAVK